MDWHNAFQAIRQFQLPRTRALQAELATLRTEHAGVSAELDAVRADLAQTRSEDTRQIERLQQELDHLVSDRDHIRTQGRLLEESLQQSRERHSAAEHRIVSLESELGSALQQAREHQSAAEQRIQSLETQLQEILTQSRQRESSAGQRIAVLEAELDDARHQHESNLYLTRDVLSRIQEEQKLLLSQQSDLVQGFQDFGRDLIVALQARLRPGMSLLQVTLLACLLFLTGVLATTLVLREADNRLDLSPISQGLVDLKQLMQAHFQTHGQLLEKLNRTLEHLPDTGSLPSATPHAGLQGELTQPGGAQPASPGAPGGVAMMPDATARSELQLIGLLTDKHPGDSAAVAAMRRFRELYRQQSAGAAEQLRLLHEVAALARADARKYHKDSRILAAIRLASSRTSVDFPFLMELAAIESNFDPQVCASTSNACGLYQFKEASWLEAVKLYGDRYALADLAARIEYSSDEQGALQAQVQDPAVLQRILKLRLEPYYAACLAAEQLRDSRRKLSSALSREPSSTDLYLMHFFGNSGGLSFLRLLDENPGRIAGELFPGAARRNNNIFTKGNRQPRTIAEIYQLLERKFDTDRFREG